MDRGFVGHGAVGVQQTPQLRGGADHLVSCSTSGAASRARSRTAGPCLGPICLLLVFQGSTMLTGRNLGRQIPRVQRVPEAGRHVRACGLCIQDARPQTAQGDPHQRAGQAEEAGISPDGRTADGAQQTEGVCAVRPPSAAGWAGSLPISEPRGHRRLRQEQGRPQEWDSRTNEAIVALLTLFAQISYATSCRVPLSIAAAATAR